MGDTPAAATVDARGRALRDLRISLTDRCNFRCDYCMPKAAFGTHAQFMPRAQILRFDEIVRIARICVTELGARKLRLTGGEPLLRRDLPVLVRELAALSGVEDLALTTNGYLLAEHAQALADSGLTRVTISIDSLDPEKFEQQSGMNRELGRVLEGLAAAERAGLTPIKINCVVQRGVNEDSIEALARRFRGTGHVVRFIEYMDVGTLNDWSRERVVTRDEILQQLARVAPLQALEPAQPGEVASRYRFVDGSAEFGVIASVSAPFCGDCSRARLSADGRLLTCLFAAAGLDLRAPLRDGASDRTLRGLIEQAWRARDDRYSELRAAVPTRRRLEMYQMGG
jgi:cyclic pyranopterin phosphate synthase